MEYKRQRPAGGAARRNDSAEQVVLTEQCNVSNPSRFPEDRLPIRLRTQYLTDCLAFASAYRHVAEARRLLEGLRP